MKNFKFALLSTIDSPLLRYFLDSISENGINDVCIIFDKKQVSDKNRNIFFERTNGELGSFGTHNLYNTGDKPIPSYFVDSHNDHRCVSLIKDLGIDCLANAGTPRKLSTELLGASPLGVVNVHPGLLPKYRGACAVEWAILNDDKVGNTAHFMVEGYDAGPIITSESYVFNQNSTYSDIRCHVYKRQCALMGKAFHMIQRDGLTDKNCEVQDERQAITRSPISNEDMHKIHDLLREGRYRFVH